LLPIAMASNRMGISFWLDQARKLCTISRR
jgi:hypothetical protein